MVLRVFSKLIIYNHSAITVNHHPIWSLNAIVFRDDTSLCMYLLPLFIKPLGCKAMAQRLLYLLFDRNCGEISNLMAQLKNDGKYTIPADKLAALQSEFYGNCASDEEASAAIKDLFERYNYLCDTHTAVAVSVYNKYLAETKDDTCCVIASTASPYKFSTAVLEAVTGSKAQDDEFAVVSQLSKVTGTKVPAPLAGLADKKVLHTSCVEKEDMAKFIENFLNI